MGDGRLVSKVTQGVTTEIMGEGWTNAPANDRTIAMSRQIDPEMASLEGKFTGPHGFDDWLRAMESHGSSVNLGSFVGSATIRAYAKGMDQGAPRRRSSTRCDGSCARRWKTAPSASPRP